MSLLRKFVKVFWKVFNNRRLYLCGIKVNLTFSNIGLRVFSMMVCAHEYHLALLCSCLVLYCWAKEISGEL